MKLKRIMAMLLASTMVLTIMAGCAKKDDADKGNSSTPSTETPAKAESGQVKKVHDEIKKVYGEFYMPNQPVDEAMLEEVFGVKKDLVKEFVAETPMISMHVDTFVAIEAKDGKAEDIEKALKAYRDAKLKDLQYPMNMPRYEASQVVRIDDYVFYVLLGNYYEGEDPDKEELDFYKAEIKKGVDKINEILKK